MGMYMTFRKLERPSQAAARIEVLKDLRNGGTGPLATEHHLEEWAAPARRQTRKRETQPLLGSISVAPDGDRNHAGMGASRDRACWSAGSNLLPKAVLLWAAILLSPMAPALAQEAAAAPPSEASSLQETYQNWRVSCTVGNNTRACSITQDQTQQNGQRLLAVEMRARPDGAAIGTLLLPFGILFDSGVTPQIDDQPPLAPLRFRTCLPTGCVALLPVDPPTLVKLRAGSVLKLKVTTAANTELIFPVSLHGLTAALDRTAELGSP
jgi:invasion protein IalB